MDILKERYEIQKTLGERDDRKTFLARDRQTETFVVVKMLLFNSELKWEDMKLFEREANTLKLLNHPAIPQYLDYFDVETTAGNAFALVQSFIAADALSLQASVGRRFDEAELKDIAREVLGVLTYLHTHQPPIVHRDIKPSNILLSAQPMGASARSAHLPNQVFLVDFGAVQATQHEGNTRTVVGTYGYMPPEQFGGRAVPASDLYGLGMTLVYLASGQQPADLPQNNLRVQFEDQVSLSRSFVQWLRKMIAPALEERFSTAQQALHALETNSLPHTQQFGSQQLDSSIIEPPPGSKVSLTKEFDRLEIVIPPSGLTFAVAGISFFSCLWNIVVLSMFFALLGENLFILLFIIPFVCFGMFLSLCILWQFKGTSVLTLSEHTISLQYKILGLSFQYPKPATRKSIFQIEKRATNPSEDNEDPSLTYHFVSIRTVAENFSLHGFRVTPLSEVELDWLAHELSEWLNLPIH